MIKINLDSLLTKKGITSKELAKKIDITEANLSILRTGKSKAIRLKTLSNICETLDCTPGDILEYVKEKNINFTVEKSSKIYIIKDENQKEIYTVKSYKNGEYIIDENGQKLADIRKKKIHLLPADLPVFEISFKEFKKIRISKELKNFKNFYEVEGIKTDRSIFDENFKIDIDNFSAKVKRKGLKFEVQTCTFKSIVLLSAFLIAIIDILEYEKIY